MIRILSELNSFTCLNSSKFTSLLGKRESFWSEIFGSLLSRHSCLFCNENNNVCLKESILGDLLTVWCSGGKRSYHSC